MNRIILLLPGLHDFSREVELLRENMPTLAQLSNLGEVGKVSPISNSELPEAEFLGLSSDANSMKQGPLTIAALGYDPPDRSTHYHLSILSSDGNQVQSPLVAISESDAAMVLACAEKLNTRRLTVCPGNSNEHGVVLEEGSPDGMTFSPDESFDCPIKQKWPQGDDEAILRRFIDDSVNLLSGLELNQERIDQGQLPLNLLWPWGGGFRQPVPNIGIRYGEAGLVVSSSIRLQGLTRLAGWKHCDRNLIQGGVGLKIDSVLKFLTSMPLTIGYFPEIQKFRAENKVDEAIWLMNELDGKLISPIKNEILKGTLSLTIVSASEKENEQGIAMKVQKKLPEPGRFPFDERMLDERMIPIHPLSEWVRSGILDSE